MKTFTVSIVLAVLMLGVIVWNAFYINNVANEMERRLDELPDVSSPDCAGFAEDLRRQWETHDDWVGLTVSYTITDRVSEQAAVLSACAECGDLYGFRTARALLRDAVGDMRRLERFHVGNLL